MLAINEILQWAADNGYANMYGNPAHINRMMHDTDFSASAEQTAVYCYLITAAETVEARDRVTVGVFFARLCEFDFDPKGLLPVQMALMDTTKRMLADLTAGNVIGYDDPVRWQFGYDDFAENVAWVCARVTFMDLAADCVPYVPPVIPPVKVYPDVTEGSYSQFYTTPLTQGFGGWCTGFRWFGIGDEGYTTAVVKVDGEEVAATLSSFEIEPELVTLPGWEFLAPYVGKWYLYLSNVAVNSGEVTASVTVEGVEFGITYDFSTICGK